MRRTIVSALASLAFLSSSRVALAAPRHDVCADVGGTLGVGISSFGSAAGWPEKAAASGVTWSFLYYYVQPNWTPDLGDFIASKASIAKGLSATMVITFYNLYARGIDAKLAECTSDPPCVQAVLTKPDLMKGYFDEFIDVLGAAKAASDAGVTTLVQVEPDSWGFMMWTFGTDGQTDASQVPVQVKSSGHPDVAAFPDDAGGLGRALLALRDKYAPAVRLGWHASNFRNGTRPEVVTSFYSSMGEWDAIVTEPPHMTIDSKQWWLGVDPARIDTNVAWLGAVSAAAHVPILVWQSHVGAMEYYLFVDPGGPALVGRFMKAGVAGILWEHQCYGGTCDDPSDPDTFRGVADDDSTPLAAPPPTFGGGAAKDLREDLAAFQKNAPGWPDGSICAKSAGGGPGGGGAGGAAAGKGGGGSGGMSSGGAGTGGSSATATGGHGGVSGPGVGGAGGAAPHGGAAVSGAGGRAGGQEPGAGEASPPETSSGSTCGCRAEPAGASGAGWLVGAALLCGGARRRRPLFSRSSRLARESDGASSTSAR